MKCDTIPLKLLITPHKVYLGTLECCLTPNTNTPGVPNWTGRVGAPKGVARTPYFNSDTRTSTLENIVNMEWLIVHKTCSMFTISGSVRT